MATNTTQPYNSVQGLSDLRPSLLWILLQAEYQNFSPPFSWKVTKCWEEKRSLATAQTANQPHRLAVEDSGIAWKQPNFPQCNHLGISTVWPAGGGGKQLPAPAGRHSFSHVVGDWWSSSQPGGHQPHSDAWISNSKEAALKTGARGWGWPGREKDMLQVGERAEGGKESEVCGYNLQSTAKKQAKPIHTSSGPSYSRGIKTKVTSPSISPALGSGHVWGLLKLLSMAERRQGSCCKETAAAATARTVKGCIESTHTHPHHFTLNSREQLLHSTVSWTSDFLNSGDGSIHVLKDLPVEKRMIYSDGKDH